MKQILSTIAAAVPAGILGAWLFFRFQMPAEVLPTENRISAEFAAQNESAKAVFAGNENRSSSVPEFNRAAEISTECVVYIKTSAQNSRQRTWMDLFFNGGNPAGGQQLLGSGSGVIFSRDGYIVTNNHVIEGAEKIEVVHNKRTYEAEIIGADPSTDLALLKVSAKELPYIKLAESDKVRVGDWVLAVGNPFNLTSTVTAGIVSAKGRSLQILEDRFPIESFIQTDAAINPGNSGGALVNTEGELIGINTAILSKTGSYAGYGFAVPSDMVAKTVRDLKEFGQLQKAFSGMEVVDIDEKIIQYLSLENTQGVAVRAVEEKGAAQKAGLEAGDIIRQINGVKIDSKSDFDEQLSYRRPGDKVTMVYERKGKMKETSVALTNMYGTDELMKREVVRSEVLGAELERLPDTEKEQLNLQGGIRIGKITRRDGLIGRLGLTEGFTVTSVNKRPVGTAEELTTLLTGIRGQMIVEGFDRRGYRKYFSYYMR